MDCEIHYEGMKTKNCAKRQDLSIKELARMAVILRLLAHPYRLKIVDILEAEKELPVHDLVTRLKLPQAAVSGHLRKMSRANLLMSKRRGKEVWYSIRDRRSLTILDCIRKKGKSPS